MYDVIPAHFKKYLPRLMQIIDCHGNRFILITKNIPRSSSCSLSAAWGLLHSSQRCMVDMVWRADHQGKWIHLQQNPLEWWSDPGGPRVHVNWRVCRCLQRNSSGTYIYEGKEATWTERHGRNQKPGSCTHTCWASHRVGQGEVLNTPGTVDNPEDPKWWEEGENFYSATRSASTLLSPGRVGTRVCPSAEHSWSNNIEKPSELSCESDNSSKSRNRWRLKYRWFILRSKPATENGI